MGQEKTVLWIESLDGKSRLYVTHATGTAKLPLMFQIPPDTIEPLAIAAEGSHNLLLLAPGSGRPDAFDPARVANRYASGRWTFGVQRKIVPDDEWPICHIAERQLDIQVTHAVCFHGPHPYPGEKPRTNVYIELEGNGDDVDFFLYDRFHRFSWRKGRKHLELPYNHPSPYFCGMTVLDHLALAGVVTEEQAAEIRGMAKDRDTAPCCT